MMVIWDKGSKERDADQVLGAGVLSGWSPRWFFPSFLPDWTTDQMVLKSSTRTGARPPKWHYMWSQVPSLACRKTC